MSAPASKPCCATAAAVDPERSGWWLIVCLFFAAAKWLVFGSLLAFLCSMKCHQPGFLADSAWLTYGRLQPAASTAFLYGFGLQAGLGMILWLLVRLGSTPLAFPGGVFAGTVLWNLGACIGVIGILAGESTGHEALEIPGYAAWILFAAYSLIAVGALATFRQRRHAELHPAQWFLLAAIFWFPWVWTTAQVLLQCVPVRGMMQPVIAWWFAAQLYFVWFGFIGLGALWYLIPLVAGRPLHSRYLAMMAFWTLVLFSGWRGMPQGAALPAWMPAMSTVTATLSIVPLLAVALNLHQTLRGRYRAALGSRVGRLAVFAATAWLLAMGLGLLAATPSVARVTDFTFFGLGVQRLFLFGFFGLAFAGLLYHALPRLQPEMLPSAALARIHVLGMVLGALFQAVPFILFGVLQGQALNAHPVKPIMDALQPGLMALRLGTLGELLLVVGGAALVVNFQVGAWRLCRSCCLPVMADALREPPAEVTR